MLNQQDLDAVRALQRPGRPDILQQLVRTYLASSAKLVEDIQAAVLTHDFSALRLAAHSMKSSSRVLGARSLADLCQQLETAAVHELAQDCDALCGLLKPEYDHVIADMQTLLLG